MKTYPLGELSAETFLLEYWQKKPLLIRQVFPDLAPLLSADELAGLACEEGVESRLIIVENVENGTLPFNLSQLFHPILLS